ncbi:protein LURP-one-related 11-like [Oryza brachyantha]|uniref:protein LURP-one-related 11-like n=1 Tax=Oryza brachyantha TaxID=4533 RepID=UPI001ADC4F9C|nr:protein LURP-one-related 11-like [Oryza brachyantha]
MAKIQPLPAASSPEWHSGGGGLPGKKQAVCYTVWMKSLVFNGHGCTVYGSDGRVAFRVDNYGCRGSRDVFFMDTAGNTLIGIQAKSFGMLKRWEARRHHDGDSSLGEMPTTPWFSVQRGGRRRGRGGAMATVTLHGGGGGGRRAYRIDGCPRKSEYRISGAGEVVAEMARKRTASGVVLGEDVLTLTVGPDADHLLVLGLVVVCGLMNRAM